MHQIRFRFPDPTEGTYRVLPRPLDLRGLLLREGRGESGGRRRVGEEAFLVMWPRRLSALNPPLGICYVMLRQSHKPPTHSE